MHIDRYLESIRHALSDESMVVSFSLMNFSLGLKVKFNFTRSLPEIFLLIGHTTAMSFEEKMRRTNKHCHYSLH